MRIRLTRHASLAAALPDAQLRRHVGYAMIVMALLDGVADRAEVQRVSEFAKALGVTERAVRNLRQLSRNRKLRLRLDIMRRFWAIDKLRERVRTEGLGAVARFFRANSGRYEDVALAERFRALRALPDSTLGREYARFVDDNGWPLPGERGPLSDII